MRTGVLAVAVGLTATVAAWGAAAPSDISPEAFRVYTRGARCGQLQLLGTYSTARAALRAAEGLRGEQRTPVEVATGPKRTNESKPTAFQVYTRTCRKAGFDLTLTLADAAEAQTFAKSSREKGAEVEVVADYTPRELYRVFGGTCSRSMRLRGTYLSAREALEVAESLGRDGEKGFRCQVTAGGGEAYTLARPAQYQVYVRQCKIGWQLEATTDDARKAEAIVQAQAKEKGGWLVEVVHRFVAK